jgi:hypothetical protein
MPVRPRCTRFIIAQMTLVDDLIEEEDAYIRGHSGGIVAEQPCSTSKRQPSRLWMAPLQRQQP